MYVQLKFKILTRYVLNTYILFDVSGNILNLIRQLPLL